MQSRNSDLDVCSGCGLEMFNRCRGEWHGKLRCRMKTCSDCNYFRHLLSIYPGADFEVKCTKCTRKLQRALYVDCK